MAGDNEQQLFFIDGELIERLMRGDRTPVQTQQQRPVTASALTAAVSLASEGRLDDAAKELQSAADHGEDTADVQAGLGHLRFEQQNWIEAEAHYAKVTQLEPGHPTAHYNLGLCLERQSKWEPAAMAFETALAIEPKRWQAQLGRGLCLLRLGQFEAALPCFEAAIEFVPSQGKDANPGRILFGNAVALHGLGRLDEVADLYKKLLPASPNATDLLANFIALSIARKDETRVKELSERLLKLQPDAPSALEGLASIALSHGDYSAAAQHGSRLVKVSPESCEAWFNLGVALQKTGRLEQAINAYRQAVRLRPDSVEANANLGAALQERGDLEGAAVAHKAALRGDPQAPGVLWNLAIACERQGNAQEAENLFATLIRIAPDWEDAAFRLGYLQLRRGSHQEAAESFQICLKKHEDWTGALVNHGLAAWKSGDLETAAGNFHRALAVEPSHSTALTALAAVLVEQNHSVDALHWFRTLKSQQQPAPELSYNLGVLLQTGGDHAAAAECYQAAVESNPAFSQALLNLGQVLKAAGKAEEARHAWSRAMAIDPELAVERLR